MSRSHFQLGGKCPFILFSLCVCGRGGGSKCPRGKRPETGTGPWRRLYLTGSHFMETSGDPMMLLNLCLYMFEQLFSI